MKSEIISKKEHSLLKIDWGMVQLLYLTKKEPELIVLSSGEESSLGFCATVVHSDGAYKIGEFSKNWAKCDFTVLDPATTVQLQND